MCCTMTDIVASRACTSSRPASAGCREVPSRGEVTQSGILETACVLRSRVQKQHLRTPRQSMWMCLKQRPGAKHISKMERAVGHNCLHAASQMATAVPYSCRAQRCSLDGRHQSIRLGVHLMYQLPYAVCGCWLIKRAYLPDQHAVRLHFAACTEGLYAAQLCLHRLSVGCLSSHS